MVNSERMMLRVEMRQKDETMVCRTSTSVVSRRIGLLAFGSHLVTEGKSVVAVVDCLQRGDPSVREMQCQVHMGDQEIRSKALNRVILSVGSGPHCAFFPALERGFR